MALRLLCEREAEIEGFAARHSWSVEAELAAPDGARFGAVLAGLDGTRIGGSDLASEAVARDAAARVRAGSFTVASVERDELRRQALPPFYDATAFLPFTGPGALRGVRELPPLAVAIGIAAAVAARCLHPSTGGCGVF